MHPIAYIDLITVLASLAAAAFVIRGWRRTGTDGLPEIPILFLVLSGLMLVYGVALFLEWSGLIELFNWHFLEDFAGVFIPFTWAFAFYVIDKSAVIRELQASRARFRNLVESTSDWIWEVDKENRYTYVSPRVERILGYTPNELLGKTPFELMPPDEAARVSAAYFEARQKKTAIGHLENINLHKDGHEVFLETSGVPIFDAKGRLTGYRGVDRDITERRKAEQLTAQRQAELDSVFRASSAGIGLVRNRRLARVNARYFEITGYPEDELVGMDLRPFYLNERDYQAVGEKYPQALENGSARIETRWRRKDQTVIDVVIYIAPLDRADPDKGFAVLVQDITELKAARQQAMAEKTRAQLYLDVAGVMIVVLDPQGKVMLLNKKGCEILDCELEQAMGIDWFSTFLPPSHRAFARNAFDRILMGQEKAVEYFENPVQTPDGSEKLIAWHNAVLRDESGRITGVVSSGEDVTAARAAEKAIRESDERLRVALSAANMGTWRWDAGTNRDTFDTSLNAMLGLSKEESLKVGDLFDMVHPDDRDAAKAEFDRAVRKHDTYIVRYRIIRPDGEIRWVLDQGRPFYDFNGKLDYVTGVVVDITDLQQAQQALQKSEHRYAMAQTVANIGSWDLEIQTGDMEWSEQVEPLFGLAAGQFKGTYEAFLESVHPDDRQHVRDAVDATIERDQEYDIEHRIVWPDGTVRWVSQTGDVFRDDSGKAVRMLGIVQDVTERVKAQEQLRQSRDSLKREIELFENMFHTIPDAIYIKDLDSHFIHVNEGWLKKAGIQDEQTVLGKTDFDIFTQEHAQPAYDDEQQIMRSGIPKIGYEEKETWPDGRVTWCLSTKMPLRDVNGNVTGLIGISLDITDRHQAQAELAETQQRFRNIVETSPMGILTYELAPDGQLVLTGSNKAANRILREDFSHRAGQTIEAIFPQLVNTPVPDEFRRICQRGGIYHGSNFEYKDQRVGGFYEFDAFRISPGKLTVIFSDVTERVHNQQTLLFTQFAVDHAGEAAFWMRSDGSFIYVNEAACRSLGYSRQELQGMSVLDIDPDFNPEKWTDTWQWLRREHIIQLETNHRTRDGRVFPVEINANLFEYDDQEYSCAFARDITDRKFAEQQREIMSQQLAARNDELQSIVFTTAHDLRSPLVNITGFSHELEKGLTRLGELLRGARLDKDAARQIDYLFSAEIPESLGFIKSGAQRMDTLLNGILRLSRVGSAVLKTEPIDMNDLMERVLEDLRYRINSLDLDISVKPDLPDCVGDFSLLSQVFTNLLDNAIKYRRPDEQAVIEVGGSTLDDYAEYRVADNGIGIAPEHQEKVFELFHRLDTSRDEHDGEGLGLTIVRRILDRLGGAVRIDSTPGLGTTIYVRLPRV